MSRRIELTQLLESFKVPFVRSSSDSLYYHCPFCEDKEGKFNVIPGANVWRCARCGAGGGVVHFVEHIKSCDREEAKQFLRSFDSSQFFEVSQDIQRKIEKARENQEELASEDVRNSTYERMLQLLRLREEHYSDLKRRGLSDIAIDAREYKSLPKSVKGAFNTSVPRQLIKEGFSLKGVPGFFRKDNVWCLNNISQGYLIPFRNVNGKITNLQIRTDDPQYGKYMSFSSSGLPHGTKVVCEAHFISKVNNPKTVYLTEGGLKGDIASFYIKKLYGKNVSFLCIPGVNNTGCLIKALEVLKSRGLTRVVDCFDMDKKGSKTVKCNENVKKAITKIKNICENELKLEFSSMTWETEKGIDDYLFAQFNKGSH